MRKFSKGALVYLPTGVKLYQLTDGAAVVRYKVIPKPSNVLFIGKRDDGYSSILYEGEGWCVPTDAISPLRGDDDEH